MRVQVRHRLARAHPDETVRRGRSSVPAGALAKELAELLVSQGFFSFDDLSVIAKHQQLVDLMMSAMFPPASEAMSSWCWLR